ncbi:sensor histidine kinase [Paenibacillus radicis (ex Gao et al. 2016)]|uniref:histidine kinase n=1 Tax=Paenibacillus radicis (ex Gao et al. 2016) TaxID=1737354 RepID=A0A917GN68_9BACL|nr:sensor histidine kinase [Paenibacillus radicis (ex Gao et al. 2016)]GGG51604.1 sensor histidine kinase [Paenibacillus radicis (ex Gao et al. 2016)]
MKIIKIFTDRNFNLKLKTQLTASFLIMILCIITVFSYVIYSSVLSILKNQSEELVIRQFRQAEYNVHNVRDQMEKVAELLTTNKDIQSFLDYPSSPNNAERVILANEVIKTFDSILGTYPYTYSLSLYCLSGEALSTTGSNSWYTTRKEDVPFFASELYDSITAKRSGFTWNGDYDFSLFNTADRTYAFMKQEPLMTMARNLNLFGSSSKSAVLVINMKQSDFGTIYTGDWNNKGSQYLINDEGHIVSSLDAGSIGSTVQYASSIDRDRQFGSFAASSDGQTKQITYYRIQGTGWLLINETLETEFIRNTSILKKNISLLMAISIVLAFLLSVYWIYRITRPFSYLVHAMREMEMGKMGVVLDETPSTELGIIGRRFNKMSLSLEDLMEENKKIEAEKRQLEMEALQFQINPHFLYNALNTIKWIAMVRKEPGIVDAITTLGNMLRSIYKENSLFTTLQEELAYLENYLKIMNIRYGEGVDVKFDVPEQLLSYKIIRFILQPIVENAFVHGMSSISYKGSITISVEKLEEDLYISVADNGKGMKPEKAEELRAFLKMNLPVNASRQGSIGLANVNRRIKTQYDVSYGMSIHSEPERGTTVVIRVPAVK